MSLREELAIQLRVSFYDGDPHGALDVGMERYWLALADECIRQMEWARRPEREMSVIEVWEKGGKRHPNIVQNLPITIAPLDWNP